MRTTTLALLAMAALAEGGERADVDARASSAALTSVLQRAELQAARQSWDAAVAAYKEAIVANSGDAALHNRLGICYQRMGNAKEARKAYKKSIDLREDYAEVWNNIGTLDHARGRYKQAISAYSKAIRLDPRSAVFHKNLGGAWLARGNVDKALEAWSEAYRLDPAIFESKGIVVMGGADLARQYYLYAKLLAARGETGRAFEYLSKALSLGFKDFSRIERDQDFAALVVDPRYAALK
jgi:tetratricopeptide (TPR) repeat protein